MEPFTWFVAICLWLAYMATEVPYAIRGKTSPRKQARIERAKARQAAAAAGGQADTAGEAGVADSPTPGREALLAWWGDWCADATDWRRRRRDQQTTRRRMRQVQRDLQPIMPDAGSLSALAKRLRGSEAAELSERMPNGMNAGLHQQFLERLEKLGALEDWKANMAALSRGQRCEYWARIAADHPRDVAARLDNELAEYQRLAAAKAVGVATGDYGHYEFLRSLRFERFERQLFDDMAKDKEAKEKTEAEDKAGRYQPAAGPLLRSVPDNNLIHFPRSDGGTGVSNNEVVTLGQAIAWGEQQSEQAQAAVSDAEIVSASLASQEVSGEPLALCAQIQEAASTLAALYTQFAETMSTHTGVAEAYAGAPDAGNKDFNQLG